MRQHRCPNELLSVRHVDEDGGLFHQEGWLTGILEIRALGDQGRARAIARGEYAGAALC